MCEDLFSSHSFRGGQDVATMSLVDHMRWHNAEGPDALQEKMAKARLVDRRPGIIGVFVYSTETLTSVFRLNVTLWLGRAFKRSRQ